MNNIEKYWIPWLTTYIFFHKLTQMFINHILVKGKSNLTVMQQDEMCECVNENSLSRLLKP